MGYHRLVLVAVLLTIVSGKRTGLQAAAPDVIALGRQTQLFVDDLLVARKEGVVRHAHPGRKLPQPVLVPEKPWEGDRVYLYGTVLYDPQQELFRMWYMGLLSPAERDPRLCHTNDDVVLYATSHDGIHWERPELGLFSYDGSTANNIVFDMHSPSVTWNEQEPDPAKRFTMVGVQRREKKGCYWAACSPDGLHWSDAPGNPIVPNRDTITLMHDPKSGEYFAFHKQPVEWRGHRRRLVYLTTSGDFAHWSSPELALAPDEQDDAWTTEPIQRTEFYNLSAFPYGGQFLGLVTVFRVQRELASRQPHQSGHDGPIEAQLVHSRDGRHWQRCEDRQAVIANGPYGYDAGCILGVANLPVIHGDEMWLYYTAITTTHGGALPEKKIAIARAAWRLDGWVSLDAAEEGSVETVPVRTEGGTLVLNADAGQGRLRVEVLNEQGEPLPGYSRQECLPLEGDQLHHSVRWQTHNTLPADQPVRFRFLLERCRLYSFRQET